MSKVLSKGANVLACLGDSISAYNSDASNGSQQSLNARGFLTQTVQLLRGRAYFPIANNFGVAGETTTQILARVQSVISSGAGICTVLAGANDLNTSPLPTVSAITTNLRAIYDALYAAGVTIIAMTPTPRGVWSNLSAGEITNSKLMQQAVNRWIKDQYSRYRPGAFFVADTAHSFVDYNSSSASVLTATTGDNLHPIGLGAFYMAQYPVGQSLYAILDSILPPARPNVLRTDLYDATYNPTGNLFTNGQVGGTAGTAGTGVTGSVASSLTISRSSGTVLTATASKEALKDDSGNTLPQDNSFNGVQVLALGATGTGAASETLRSRFSINAGGTTYAAGDVIEVSAEIEQISVVNVLSIILSANDFDGVTNFNSYGNSASGVGADREPANAIRLITTPRFTVRPYAGSGTQAITVDILVNCICSGTAPSGTIKLRNISVRKIV